MTNNNPMPLNGHRVIDAVRSALGAPPSAASVLRSAIDAGPVQAPEPEREPIRSAPDGTNGTTKSSRAVDPTQGHSSPSRRRGRDPLEEFFLNYRRR